MLRYTYSVCLVLYINVCVLMEEPPQKNRKGNRFLVECYCVSCWMRPRCHIACTPGQFNCQIQIKLVLWCLSLGNV